VCVYVCVDHLMKALVSGQEGFAYLSNVLCVLLQTLLQDKLAEASSLHFVNYSSIRISLSKDKMPFFV